MNSTASSHGIGHTILSSIVIQLIFLLLILFHLHILSDYNNICIQLIYIQHQTFNCGLQWKFINKFQFLRVTAS